MKIRHSYPTLDKKEQGILEKVISTRCLSEGKYIKAFEEVVSKSIGVKYAILVNSGTSAIHLCLLSLGLGSGDEVIVPSFVCTALLNAINYVGAKPVLADINDYDFNISFEDTKRKITKKTKAIILPHLFGLPCDLDKFLGLGIPVIEDCAQSPGAKFKGKPTGGFGKMSVFSFYATKMFTTGEGGMLLTNSSKLARIAKDLRSYDNKKDYRLRFNYKASELNAALGLVQFKKLSSFIKRRRKIANLYTKALKNIEGIMPQDESRDKFNVYFRYCIKTKNNSSGYIKLLNNKGIEAKKPIYRPLHRYLGLSDSKFTNTTDAFNRILSLPIYPELTNNQVNKIIQVTKKTLKL